MKRSQKHFWNISQDIDLGRIILTAFEKQQTPDLMKVPNIRCRVLYSKEIEKIEFLPYTPYPLSTLEFVEDNNIDYSFKMSDRIALNALKMQSNADDVIIIKKGFLTDISYANMAFYDGNRWLTPKSPLLSGTKRAFLLNQKAIFEKNIQKSDLLNFNKIKIFNAMIEADYEYEFLTDSIISLKHPKFASNQFQPF